MSDDLVEYHMKDTPAAVEPPAPEASTTSKCAPEHSPIPPRQRGRRRCRRNGATLSSGRQQAVHQGGTQEFPLPHPHPLLEEVAMANKSLK